VTAQNKKQHSHQLSEFYILGSHMYALVACALHYHSTLYDIKCILSGKAAKAAMFYITDYITKMSTKTHEMLSLMSKANAQNPRQHETTDQVNAKTLT